MKKVSILILLSTVTVTLFAQSLTPVSEGSTVKFKIKNFGFNVDGSFTGLKGTIQYDPGNSAAAAFDVSIDANSVNTDNNMRDNHLREDTYFDVKNYPVIHFVSVKTTASGKNGGGTVTGKLTLKKTTKDISFPFTATAVSDGFVFDGEFKINRKDFGVGGSSTLSDNVIISLHVYAKK